MEQNNSSVKWQKILMPLLAVFIAVVLVKEGYAFGQWLFKTLH